VIAVRRCLGILCRAGRDERGAALVEFALVLPLLLTLLLGTIDFGKAFNYWNDQTQLAATGARFAAVNHNPGGGTLQQYIQSQADTTELRNGGTAQVASPVSVCITFPAGTSNPGDPVQVTVTSQYNWLGFVRSRTGIASTTLTGSATMRLEATPTNYGAGCT
jgi:Flp pilus assembly protein TadG